VRPELTTRASHALEEHTGELALRIEAPTLPELFEEAGRALAESMRAENGPGLEHEERVTATAADREALLVAWLNELVYRAEVNRVLPGGFRIERLSDQRLEAVVRGRRFERLRNPVKAATYHGLSITQGAHGLVATVVLDV
jgi:SHS2 domain-containing protein